LSVRRAAIAGAILSVASVAHADPIEQDHQLTFGVVGTYVPSQNNLIGTDIFALGHYVAYTHAIDCFHVGARLAASIGTGPQFLIDPTVFMGLHFRTGRLALRIDVGTGPYINGGDGFATGVIDHTYLRAAAQVRIVKSVVVEAFGGPGLVIGPSVAGVLAEWGIGAGWNF